MTPVEDKAFCPFCDIPLPLWGDRRRFVPIISETGDFYVKCRSKTCKGRRVYIDIRVPILVA